MRKKNGITLVALVITIIVLLILAGVTLYTLFGEEGVITKSRQSVKQNEWGITREQLMLQLTDYVLNKTPKEEGKDYIEYFLEDGYINTDSVVQMEKIANNTLKLGRGNLEEGDVYYFESERLYYLEKTGERIDLGPFVRLGSLPAYLLWRIEPEDGGEIDFDNNEDSLGFTISNWSDKGVTNANIDYTVTLVEGSDSLTVNLDGIELIKGQENSGYTIIGGEKQEKHHVLSVVEKGNPLIEEQNIQLKIHGKTQGEKAREEDRYINITIKPKRLYWNTYTNTERVELNVDNASLDLFMENYQQDNVTKHDIDYEISLENKDINPFLVTIEGTNLADSSYTGTIVGEDKKQEKKTIIIQKQDGKPITTNEQITLKFKINSPLPAEKTFTIEVKQYWLIDYSGNGYHAKLKNGAEIIKETDGYALKLDGVDDYVELPTLLGSHGWKNGVDIEGAFKCDTLNPYANILTLSNTALTDSDWDDHIVVRLYASEPRIYFEATGHGIIGDVIFKNGTDKGTFSLGQKQTFKVDMFERGGFFAPIYINGSKASGDGQILTIGYPIPNVDRKYNYIGRSPWSTNYFKGYIYDLAIRPDGSSSNIFYYNVNR